MSLSVKKKKCSPKKPPDQHNKMPLHDFISTNDLIGHVRNLLHMQQLQSKWAKWDFAVTPSVCCPSSHLMLISVMREKLYCSLWRRCGCSAIDHLFGPTEVLVLCFDCCVFALPTCPPRRALSSKLLSRVKQRVEYIKQPCWLLLPGFPALAWQATYWEGVGVCPKCASAF